MICRLNCSQLETVVSRSDQWKTWLAPLGWTENATTLAPTTGCGFVALLDDDNHISVHDAPIGFFKRTVFICLLLLIRSVIYRCGKDMFAAEIRARSILSNLYHNHWN